jgi:hypothetical protein
MIRLATCLRALSPARKPRPPSRDLRVSFSWAKAVIANSYAFLSDRIASATSVRGRPRKSKTFDPIFAMAKFGAWAARGVSIDNQL